VILTIGQFKLILMVILLSLSTTITAQDSSNLSIEQIKDEYDLISKKLKNGKYGAGSEVAKKNIILIGSYAASKDPTITDCISLERKVPSLLPASYTIKGKPTYCPTIKNIVVASTSILLLSNTENCTHKGIKHQVVPNGGKLAVYWKPKYSGFKTCAQKRKIIKCVNGVLEGKKDFLYTSCKDDQS
jgi:hypothetical protein